MMETNLYTIHTRRGDETRLRIVGDGRHPLAVIPPVWAIWRGLWIVFLIELAALVTMAVVLPTAVGTLYLGLLLLTFLEGATLERAELALRGWEEVGVAEARTEEGAEEEYRMGRAVLP
ncbi:MAG: hypothetical protein AAFV96_17685 [Pseudomonadota bacterium]